MKKVDLTNRVMGNVVRFEKKRIRFWLVGSATTLLILLSGFLFLAWVFQGELFERRILPLFSLFNEDIEIIGEFWQDTMGIIWEEIPREVLFLLIISFIAFIIFIMITKKKLKIIKKKLTQLEKYHKLQ